MDSEGGSTRARAQVHVPLSWVGRRVEPCVCLWPHYAPFPGGQRLGRALRKEGAGMERLSALGSFDEETGEESLAEETVTWTGTTRCL